MMLDQNGPLAVAVTVAIRSGDVDALTELLRGNPELATVRISNPNGACRTLLHITTDWPGHYPNGVAKVGALIAAGAEVNAAFIGPHAETPLRWAASSDDLEVLKALLDAGRPSRIQDLGLGTMGSRRSTRRSGAAPMSSSTGCEPVGHGPLKLPMPDSFSRVDGTT